MIFTHAFAGAIIGKFLINKREKQNKEVSEKEKTIIYFLAIIGSIFPDLDLISNFFDATIKHRYLLTHSFVTYTVVLIICWAILRKSNKDLLSKIVIFYFGVLSHLILDFFAGGLVALAPFTYKNLGFPISFTSTSRIDFARTYISSNYMLVETVIFLVYYFYVFHIENNKAAKTLPFIFFLIASVMLGTLAML